MELLSYNLQDLPITIANCRRKALEIDSEINVQHALRQEILADVELTIAADATLSNDTKRKAAKQLAIGSHQQYLAIENNLRVLQILRAEKEIELEFYRNEMKVAIALRYGSELNFISGELATA